MIGHVEADLRIRVRLRSLVDEMQPGAVLFFPLFDRENSSPKVSELGEFFLDFLQSFKSLAVSDLSLGSIAVLTS